MTFKILSLHGMSQNAEIFRTRLGRLPHKARQTMDVSFHFANAPHFLPLKAEEGDEVPMRTWYIRDMTSGRIDSASLQASLLHLDEVWATDGPFDGVLGFSMGGSMAVIVASLPARYTGLRCLLVGGARELPVEVLQQLGEGSSTKVPSLLSLPSLHLMGAADKVVPADSSRQLASRFVDPIIIEHEQGHCIPSRAAMLNRYVQFLKDVHDSPLHDAGITHTQNSESTTSSNTSSSGSNSSQAKAFPLQEVVETCFSDEIASMQTEEMEVLDSIFPAEINLLRDLPTAQGHPTVSFSVKLSYSGDPAMLPCVHWKDSLSLLVTLPAQYPLQGVPQLQVSAGRLGMDQFGSGHRASLLKAVRYQAQQTADSGSGEMSLLDCIQAGNDWLSGEGWKVGCQESGSGGEFDNTLDSENNGGNQGAEKEHKEVEGPGAYVSGDPHQEQEWIKAATEEACTVAADAARRKERGDGEDEPQRETHSGGVWKYTVGLVGKPSAGKSTFFNACTRALLDSRGGRKVAEVAAHPFTTIEPNIGPGWYLSAQVDCDSSSGSESERSSAYGRADKPQQRRRLLPVVVKDVAGLVPGAYQGRGKGNKFLGDLCDADVLVHVVDCTGQADRDGNKVLLSPSESSSSASSPAEDAAWIREELHRWIFGNVRGKWESVVRRGEGTRGWQRASALFSGYQGFDPKYIIQKAAQRAKLDLDKAVHFSDMDIHRLVAHYLSVRFPTCLALNKIDELRKYGEAVVEECQLMARARGEVAVPVSARAECWVLEKELRAQQASSNAIGSKSGLKLEAVEKTLELSQQNATKGDEDEEDVLRGTLSRWASTGVLEAISAAVWLSPPLLCYPVADLDTEAPLGWSGRTISTSSSSSSNNSRSGHELKEILLQQLPLPPSVSSEEKGSVCSGSEEGSSSPVPAKVTLSSSLAAPRLRDCVQLKPYSTVHDVFEALKNGAIPEVALHGDFVRADGKSVGANSKRKQLRRDQVIDEKNCVIRIYANKKHTWQKDYV